MVSDFAAQFVKIETENAQLKVELAAAKVSAEQANKLAADARIKADLLEKDIGKLKAKLDKETKAKEAAKVLTEEREERLRKAVESLLGKFSELICLIALLPLDFAWIAKSVFVSSSFCRYSSGSNRSPSGRLHGGLGSLCCGFG